VENVMRKERRISDRKALSGLLPGRLQTAQGVDLVCKPVDVSPHGIGILIDKEFDVGTKLKLVMKAKTIDFQVMWAKRDFHKDELFRYGLTTADININVESIFLEAGCLK
jgi:hypothetical protein